MDNNSAWGASKIFFLSKIYESKKENVEKLINSEKEEELEKIESIWKDLRLDPWKVLGITNKDNYRNSFF